MASSSSRSFLPFLPFICAARRAALSARGRVARGGTAGRRLAHVGAGGARARALLISSCSAHSSSIPSSTSMSWCSCHTRRRVTTRAATRVRDTPGVAAGGGLPRPQEDGSSISQRAARTHLAGFSLLAAAPHCLLARLFLLRLLHLKLRLRAARPERACRCAGVLDFEGIQTDFIPGSVNRLFLEEAGPTWSRWCCISLGSRFLTHAASRRTESLNSRRPAPRAFWFSFSIARFTCPRRTAAQPRAGPLIPFILLLARSETVDRGDQECVVQGRWPRDAPGSPRDPSGFGWGDACRFGASFGLYLSHHAKARRVEKDS